MFLLLFLAPVHALLWMGSLIVFVVGKTQKSRAVSWAGGLPFAVLTVAACAALALMFMPSNPTSIYEEAFGVSPSSDVTQLQGEDSSWGDSGVAYLKFNAPPTTIRKITASGWKRQPALQDSISYYQDHETPAWWKPVVGKATIVYEPSKPSGNFASENSILVYDRVSGQAYYSYIGID